MKQYINNTSTNPTVAASPVSNLARGERITIRQIVGDGNSDFTVKIDHTDESHIYTERRDDRAQVRCGQPAVVSFVKQDALFEFDAIVDSTIRGGMNALVVTPTSLARQVQRREAIRLALRAEVRVAIIDRPIDEPIDPDRLVWEKSHTINLSATGALVHATPRCVVGDCLALRFDAAIVPALPLHILTAWRRLARHENDIYLGLEFLTGEAVSKYLLPQEQVFLPNEFTEFNETMRQNMAKFVVQGNSKAGATGSA